MLKRIIISAILFCFGCSLHAAPSPVNMLKGVSSNVIAALKNEKATIGTRPAVVIRIMNKHMVPHVEERLMARLVLGGKQWSKATTDQQKQFTDQFIQLVARSYAGALAEYTDEHIEFTRVNVSGQRARVYSRVLRNDGPNIQLNYRLILRKAAWKIYDMNIEGVSILSSYRSQFASELSQHSLDKLITKLSRKNSGKK